MSAARSYKQQRIPVVLTRDEVKQVLAFLEGTSELVVKLLYGCGLRIIEAVRLWVQDIDYGYKQVTVRNGKGNKDRGIPFPAILEPLLKNHLERVMTVHEQDLAAGFGCPGRWRANIRMRKWNGTGSIFFPAGSWRKILAAG